MHTFKKENNSRVADSDDANDIKSLTGKRRTLKNLHIQRIVSSIALILCFIFAITAGIMFYSDNNDAYAINVDGKTVAVLTSEVEASAAIDSYLSEKSQEMGCEVKYKEDVSIDSVDVASVTGFTTPVKATEILNCCLTQVIDAVIISVDGKEVLAVKDKETADNIVEKAKKYFIHSEDIIIDAKIREEITTSRGLREPSEILNANAAVNFLLFGMKDRPLYTVTDSDESLWTISSQTGVGIEDIQALNPGLTSDDLSRGMNVKLMAYTPLINVVLVKEVEKTTAVAFEVEKKDNSKMLRGQEKVITEGQKGEADVTLHIVEQNGHEINREQVNYVVTKAPVTKVVERGTKMVVASRGDGGYGVVGWPLVGRITSLFGYRWGSFHTGLDIDGSTGDPVVAAESGTVIYAEYAGRYGNMIKIDHGDGLQTWYAHLSKYYVGVGDKVAKGDLIGAVGSTGRSTGSHLHFEVRINGTAYNPLRYLP